MDRAQKAEFVTNLNQVFANAGVVVVSQNLGLTVAQSNELRRRMGEAGATVKVAKNRLAKLALEGTDAKDIAGLFSGPTMIAHSSDPVVAPKIIAEFAKQHAKFVILGAALGRTVLDADGVKALAELPSLDELRAKLVGMIQTPATRIAGILQAPGAQIARVLSAYASKDDAASQEAA